MSLLSRSLLLGVAASVASCAGLVGARDNEVAIDPCLPFGAVELQSLVAEAYAGLEPAFVEHGIAGARLVTAATIAPALGFACAVQEYRLPSGERVTTAIDGALEARLSAAVVQRAATDAVRWDCCSVRESWAVCTAAGVAYPTGLALPTQRERLRAAVASGAVRADFVLLAELYARERVAGRVELGVALELISLADSRVSLVAERHVDVPFPAGARRPDGARFRARGDLEVSRL